LKLPNIPTRKSLVLDQSQQVIQSEWQLDSTVSWRQASPATSHMITLWNQHGPSTLTYSC